VNYGRMSVSVLWLDVSECIMVGCQYYGGMSVNVLLWGVSECIMV